jgi:hypothetical protein
MMEADFDATNYAKKQMWFEGKTYTMPEIMQNSWTAMLLAAPRT